MTTLRVGLGTLSGQAAPGDRPGAVYESVIRLAEVAEEAGLDSVWIAEHHGAENAHIPSPLVVLAAVAARTKRIRLGTGIAVAPFYHPLRFAEDCALVDQISSGRLSVGIGSGWRDEEFAAFGVPLSQRGARTEDLVAVCRAAWSGDRFTYQGRHSTFESVLVTPTPMTEIPIYLGGAAPIALDRAGRSADGFFADGVPQIGLDELLRRVSILDASVVAAGRDPALIPLCFAVNAWTSTDGSIPADIKSAMWARITQSAAWHRGQPGDDAGAGDIDHDEIDRRAWLGTPSQIANRALEWLRPFAGRPLEILFRCHHPGIPFTIAAAQVRLIGQEIAPRLRAAVGS